MPVADDGYSLWIAGDFVDPEPEPFDEDDPWLDDYGNDITDKRRAGEPYVGPYAVGVKDGDIPMTSEESRHWQEKNQ